MTPTLAPSRSLVVPLVVGVGCVLVLLQAFVPLERFIRRGDDAFYYFRIALNYADLGFWTFDGVSRTNGVQPLWGMMLSALAIALRGFGVSDPMLAARAFVAFSGLVHLSAVLVLYRVVREQVSPGTALAVAGGLLLPVGTVWISVWGMENPVYLLFLALDLWAWLRFRNSPSLRWAAVFGLALGFTGLARLNAGLLVPFACLGVLLYGPAGSWFSRLRATFITGALASVVLVPYFAYNLNTTGHALPISGLAKVAWVTRFLEAHDVSTKASVDYLKLLAKTAYVPLRGLFTSRVLDGVWPLGGRVVFANDTAAPLRSVAVFVGLLLLLPVPRLEWFRYLWERALRLWPFWPLLALAVFDTAISLWSFPNQAGYAAVRWWFVPLQLVILLCAATFASSWLSFVQPRVTQVFEWLPSRLAERLALLYPRWAPALLVGGAFLLVAHASALHAREFFLSKQVYERDWNPGWSGDTYRAVVWANQELPKDARVGVANAGLFGYLANFTVINTDGLVNDASIVPYIREDRLADYVRERQIPYVADAARALERDFPKDSLPSEIVFRSGHEGGAYEFLLRRVTTPASAK